jgi:hypothetical protein
MTQQESSPDFRMEVVPISLATLRPYPKNPRTHSKKQTRQIADSIRRFGFTNPVLVSDDDEIIAGHGRVEAAKLLQMKSVPAVRLSHLNAAQRKAYVIADNKLALNSGWDHADCALPATSLYAPLTSAALSSVAEPTNLSPWPTAERTPPSKLSLFI